jgi:outer membrane biosynthesis protein TonB
MRLLTMQNHQAMEEELLSTKEKNNRRKGLIISIIAHTLLLALAILPLLTYPDPPPGQEGILVNLGADFGEGFENAPEPAITEEAPVEEEQEQPVEEEVIPEPEVEQPEPDVVPEKEVVESEDPDAIALKKKKEKEERERQERLEQERLEKERLEQERLEKERQEQEFKDKKNKFSGAFGGGDGEGKGDDGTPGNKGDKDGDPDATKLEGKSTGKGQVGGGLGDRGILFSPKVTDSSQKTGTVVLKVCVDSSGRVISAEYTQAGSTTTDSRLRAIAVSNAQSWKFSKSSLSRQCGTIKYEFRVQ